MSDKDIQVILGEGLKVDARYKGFVIKTDQPKHQGGDGTAPAPFDLFLVSIAACAGFYVLEFCRTRKIPTDRISVTMKTERGPESKRIEKISILVGLPPDFPDKYKTAVVKAVDTCSVKAHILKPPLFEITAEKEKAEGAA
jgi:ribosomal protein S12 methylthiotransferase accessory factor